MHEDLISGPRDAYALGGDPPRCIGQPSSEVSSGCGGTGVLVRGCLHWNPEQHQSGRGMITLFDTTTESFRMMRAPVVPNWKYGPGVYTNLFEMDGKLGMLNYNDGKLHHVNIWVLQDYEEVWKLRYQVELPMSEIKHMFDGYKSWRVMAVHEEGNVVVLVHGDRWLLHVDTEGKLQASFHRDGQGLMLHSGMIKQSLVPHAFFPKLYGYVVNDSTFI